MWRIIWKHQDICTLDDQQSYTCNSHWFFSLESDFSAVVSNMKTKRGKRPFQYSDHESEAKEETAGAEEVDVDPIFPVYSARSQQDMNAMVHALAQVIGNNNSNPLLQLHDDQHPNPTAQQNQSHQQPQPQDQGRLESSYLTTTRQELERTEAPPHLPPTYPNISQYAQLLSGGLPNTAFNYAMPSGAAYGSWPAFTTNSHSASSSSSSSSTTLTSQQQGYMGGFSLHFGGSSPTSDHTNNMGDYDYYYSRDR
ncbi:hypothetical protein PVK06_045221 [Gossypium arboreum]|uniref:Uncharacterized protein n=1 Tax=Gossypium arboreum TaxID=29729 RepID=A0ABR0MTH3_GOSAR|nr:hypothetical protein PVK06_045221 [Gossypium arboreum]